MNKKVKFSERIRLICQAISFAFHNGYIKGWTSGQIYSGVNKSYCVPGLNCYSCPGAIGACPIGSLQAVLGSGAQHYSLYVLGTIGTVGVLCGRLICGWLCPFGLVQDLLHKIPLFKKVKNMPGHKYLRYLRFLILAVFVVILPMVVVNKVGAGSPWFCEYICPSGTLLGGIPLIIFNPAMRGSIGLRFAWKVLLLIAVLVLSVKFFRPFCKYVCPLGALYGCGNCISLYRLRVDREKCIECGACQQACGMDIKVWEKPNSIDCIRCGKCKATCPKGAISSSLDSVVKATGFTKKHQPIDFTKVYLGGKIRRYILASGLLLLVSGLIAATLKFKKPLSLLVGSGELESKAEFIAYGLLLSGIVVPAMINIVLGIKLLLNYRKTEKIEELLECTVMAGKFIILALAAGILYGFFLVYGLDYAVNSFLSTGVGLLMNGAFAVPICSVLAYCVLKRGIKKCSVVKDEGPGTDTSNPEDK